jgi:hypothetical protein
MSVPGGRGSPGGDRLAEAIVLPLSNAVVPEGFNDAVADLFDLSRATSRCERGESPGML